MNNKPAQTAPEFLNQAAAIMEERGKQYDKPGGERSMGRTVEAFNVITGRTGDRALSEAEGWLLMQVLKDVRQWQTPGKFHRDSGEDSVAYAGLKCEALARSGPGTVLPGCGVDGSGCDVRKLSLGFGMPIADKCYTCGLITLPAKDGA